MKACLKCFLVICLLGLCGSTTHADTNVWVSWNNGQTIGSFFGIAGRLTETVAVGIDGLIATRNNGTGFWTILNLGGDPDFRDVIFANGQYVTVRESGIIMTSPDGYSWTSQTSGTTNDLRAVIWDGQQFIAAGQNGTILTSPDAFSWTLGNSNGTIFFNSLSFSGTKYIAVGGNGIRVSNDAINWTTPTNAPTSISFEASTWSGSQFVVGGLGFSSTPTVYTSVDGNTWTLANSTIEENIEGMVTVNGVVYMTGTFNGTGNGFVYKSSDGTNWVNTYTNPNGLEYFSSITYNGQDLIVAGFNHNVFASSINTNPLCPSGISSTNHTFGSNGDSGTISVIASNTCTWAVLNNYNWVHFSQTGGIGNASLNFTIDPTTTNRTANISIGDWLFMVTQTASAPTNLTILQALYGANGMSNNVTSIIQANVITNTVNMSVNNGTMGGDPAPGHVKTLYVLYQSIAGLFQQTVSEGGTLTIPSPSAQQVAWSYLQWTTNNFSSNELANPNLSGPLGDADGNGIPNLMKYALGIDPHIPSVSRLPRVSLLQTNGNQFLSLSYSPNPFATNLNYAVEVSGDLANWNSGIGYTYQLTPLGQSPVVVIDWYPISANIKRFIHLNVSQTGQ